MPVKTELGTMLVTTPEQTPVDLVLDHAGQTTDVHEAMRGLARKVDWAKVDTLARNRHGGRRALDVLHALRGELAA